MAKKQVSEIFHTLRQLRFPKAFRIPRLASPTAPKSNVDHLVKVLREVLEKAEQAAEDPGSAQVSINENERFLADLATRLWRIGSKMVQPDSGEPFKNVERGYRHLERLLDLLEEKGVRIVDKSGDFYDPGMAMQVISSEPTEGIERELIKETIQPAVLLNGRMIQTAQIIVGTPALRETDEESPQTKEEKEAGS